MRLTPHPSHRFGRVAGERRCTKCWSAPEWDIIEQACPSEGRAPDDNGEDYDRVVTPPWSDADLERAWELYQARVPMVQIAATVGRTLAATERRIREYREARGIAPLDRRRISRATMDAIARMPGTLSEVARANGVSHASVGRARAALAERMRRASGN